MTKQERKYLRAAFHHFDEKKSFDNLPEYEKALVDSRNYKKLLRIVFNVLCIEGDEEGMSIEELEEIFQENKIDFIK